MTVGVGAGVLLVEGTEGSVSAVLASTLLFAVESIMASVLLLTVCNERD